MATKILIAQKRLFHDVFICKKCEKKIRSQAVRINAGKIRCPRCNGRSFRTINKK